MVQEFRRRDNILLGGRRDDRPLGSAAKSEAALASRRGGDTQNVGVWAAGHFAVPGKWFSYAPSAEIESWPLRRGTERFPYESFRDEILGFMNLPVGWDSYSAKAPTGDAVKSALSFVELLEKHCVRIEWTAPTNDDSIMVSIKLGDAVQEWDFYSDGDVAVTVIESSGTKHFIEVMPRDIEKILLGGYGRV